MNEEDKRAWANAKRVVALFLATAAGVMTLVFAGLFVSASYQDYSGGLQNSKAAAKREKYAAERAFYAACESALADSYGSAFGFRAVVPPACPR